MLNHTLAVVDFMCPGKKRKRRKKKGKELKKNINVDEAAKFLVKHILQTNEESVKEEERHMQIHLKQQTKINSACC